VALAAALLPDHHPVDDSFALAWIIAVFLDLAILSDIISERVKRDHLVGNQPIFQKIDPYETQLNREIGSAVSSWWPPSAVPP